MFTLFDQPFKINKNFDSKANFEAFNKIFTYYDIDAYFNSTDEYHLFLANGLSVETA